MPSFKELIQSSRKDDHVRAIEIEISWYKKTAPLPPEVEKTARDIALKQGYAFASQYLRDQFAAHFPVPTKVKVVKVPHIRKPVDRFVHAWQRVEDAESLGEKGRAIFFGAYRNKRTSRHFGIDLPVPVGTPIQIPSENAVLIGKIRNHPQAGNALFFFVPDDKQPYFVSFLHLSEKTFDILGKLKVRIGSTVSRNVGVDTIIAYTGESGNAQGHPHLHVTAMEVLHDPALTASHFQELYNSGTLADFLKGGNFAFLTTPARKLSSLSLEGYFNPVDLRRAGKLEITSVTPPVTVATSENAKAVRP